MQTVFHVQIPPRLLVPAEHQVVEIQERQAVVSLTNRPNDIVCSPHPVNLTLENTSGTAPDRLRLVAVGIENDMNFTSRRHRGATISCTKPNVPEKNESYEWNYAEIDFDLTKYPGVRVGDSFVRRSKALANGSTVSFEIRGSFLVTRQ